MCSLAPIDLKVPLYSAYGLRIGSISVDRAIDLHGRDLELRARGTGRRRHFTSAKLYARVSQLWLPMGSGGYVVLQLITQ